MRREKEAARQVRYPRRASMSGKDKLIVSENDRAVLVGGLLFAVSFGCMFVWAAVMW